MIRSHQRIVTNFRNTNFLELGNCFRNFSISQYWATRFLKLKTIIYHGKSPIKWIPSVNGQRPPGAVEGGFEGDRKLHVIRSHHEGGLFPGKLNCFEEKAFIANLGREQEKHFYEVLVAPYAAVKWIPWKNDKEVLANAIIGGVTETGDALLIGRAKHSSSLIIGKVDPIYEICYIPYKGFAFGYKDFDVLVQNTEGQFPDFDDFD